MTEPALIGMMNTEGDISYIRSTEDGHPSATGQALLKRFEDPAAASRLISSGDVQSVQDKSNPTEPAARQDTRPATEYQTKRSENIRDLYSQAAKESVKWVYIYNNGDWYYTQIAEDYYQPPLMPLLSLDSNIV